MLPKHYSLWNVTYFKPKIIIKYTHETLYTHILTHKKNKKRSMPFDMLLNLFIPYSTFSNGEVNPDNIPSSHDC